MRPSFAVTAARAARAVGIEATVDQKDSKLLSSSDSSQGFPDGRRAGKGRPVRPPLRPCRRSQEANKENIVVPSRVRDKVKITEAYTTCPYHPASHGEALLLQHCSRRALVGAQGTSPLGVASPPWLRLLGGEQVAFPT